MEERSCPYCGAAMANPRRVQCGAQECRRQYQADRMRNYLRKRRAEGTLERYTWQRTCTVCARRFETVKHDAKYCSTGAGSCEAVARSAEYKGRADIVERITEAGAEQAALARHANAVARLTAETKSAEWAYRRALRADPCAYCGNPSEATDHIVPRSDGGEDTWENFTAACHRCNSYKGKLPLLPALLFIPTARNYHELRRALLAPRAA